MLSHSGHWEHWTKITKNKTRKKGISNIGNWGGQIKSWNPQFYAIFHHTSRIQNAEAIKTPTGLPLLVLENIGYKKLCTKWCYNQDWDLVETGGVFTVIPLWPLILTERTLVCLPELPVQNTFTLPLWYLQALNTFKSLSVCLWPCNSLTPKSHHLTCHVSTPSSHYPCCMHTNLQEKAY